MMAPATGFYSTPSRGLDEVRISYVLNVDDLKHAMKALEEALKVYPGRKKIIGFFKTGLKRKLFFSSNPFHLNKLKVPNLLY